MLLSVSIALSRGLAARRLYYLRAATISFTAHALVQLLFAGGYIPFKEIYMVNLMQR